MSNTQSQAQDQDRLARLRLWLADGLFSDDRVFLLAQLAEREAEVARLCEGFADIGKSLLESAAIEEVKRAYLQGAADMKEKLHAPKEFSGADVNAVLRLVTSISANGDCQLSILATALAVACRSCGVPKERAAEQLVESFDRAPTLVSLGGEG